MRHGSAFPVFTTTVIAEWVDYNGHMNDAAYALVFSRSLDALLDKIGLEARTRERMSPTVYTMQAMLHYFKEAREGEAVTVAAHVLEHDDKRIRVWLDMSDASGERLAASEQLLLSIARGEGAPRAAPWTFETMAALEALAKAQRDMPHPPEAGAGVAMRRK